MCHVCWSAVAIHSGRCGDCRRKLYASSPAKLREQMAVMSPHPPGERFRRLGDTHDPVEPGIEGRYVLHAGIEPREEYKRRGREPRSPWSIPRVGEPLFFDL